MCRGLCDPKVSYCQAIYSGVYDCVCRSGYSKQSPSEPCTGTVCYLERYCHYSFIMLFVDVDECFTSPSPCVNNTKCFNSRGNFSCICDTGYVGDGKVSGVGCTGED